jgi:hypothetical protein
VIDDTIRSYAKYAKREEAVVKEWLEANNYLS